MAPSRYCGRQIFGNRACFLPEFVTLEIESFPQADKRLRGIVQFAASRLLIAME
jgi:hypothetical protein